MNGLARMIDINSLDEKTREMILNELTIKNINSENQNVSLPVIPPSSKENKKSTDNSSYYKSYRDENETTGDFLKRRMRETGYSVNVLSKETHISENLIESYIRYNHPIQKEEAWKLSEELECHVKDLLPKKKININMFVARMKKKITLSKMANILNIDLGSLSAIENGNVIPTNRASKKIGEFLGIKFENVTSNIDTREIEKLKGAKFFKERRMELKYSIYHISRELNILVERIEKLEKFGFSLKSHETYRIAKFLKCSMSDLLTSSVYKDANWYLINRRYQLNLSKTEIEEIINYQLYLKLENNKNLIFSLNNEQIENICSLFKCTEDDLLDLANDDCD